MINDVQVETTSPDGRKVIVQMTRPNVPDKQFVEFRGLVKSENLIEESTRYQIETSLTPQGMYAGIVLHVLGLLDYLAEKVLK